jgi:protein-tyrosine phosphatase
MIDIHTHLLPGVDDGSPSIAASLPILERFAAGGVETVVCTPHLNASSVSSAPFAHHAEILEALVAAAPRSPKLLLGWEIMLDVPRADLSDIRLTLGGSNAVLVEFPRMSIPPNATAELARLRESGVVPVVAHPERYWSCNPRVVAEWRDAGAVIQMDVSAVVAGKRMVPFVAQMLEQSMVDLFASDTHGDARSLVPARKWLAETASEEHAELLTRENPRRVLTGKAPLPVPSIERRRGMFERLRELMRETSGESTN